MYAVQPPGLHVVRHHDDAPGPRVVLVHGAPDRSKNFAAVVDRLADLPVTVYDRRGYGKSLAAGAEGGFNVHAATSSPSSTAPPQWWWARAAEAPSQC